MKIKIIPASKELMLVIQNMARFYAYDLSKSCGFYELYDWYFPENGLYEALDVSPYWEPNCYPFIIRVDDELANKLHLNLLHSNGSNDRKYSWAASCDLDKRKSRLDYLEKGC